MAVELVMPKLAMAMQQGTVVEWTVAEGAKVDAGQIVLVIETEKVNYECEAPAAGFLHIVVEPDNTVPVYEILALVTETEAELEELQRGSILPSSNASAAPADAGMPEVTGADTGADKKKKKIKISPLAKKLAAKNKIDISRIKGTGTGGRILKEDVEKTMANPASSPELPPAETIDGKRVKATLPVRGMRKAIARHMHSSLATSAQLTVAGEADMTRIIRLREALLKKEEEMGVRISFTDLIVLAMAKAVSHAPTVNSSLINDEIKIWENINVSVAVSLGGRGSEGGLVAPVLKNCETRSLTDISMGIKEISGRARKNALLPGDLSGGTITISNVGVFGLGWTISTPILNQPQAILVQPGGIFEKPVVKDGQIKIRSMMTISITFDHRILDGGPVGMFFGKLIELIENPALLHF
jgi:pyruvate dehydrogenase E2 component (dihydrolipoyllysine-residue acetyltransferase)